MLRKGCSRWCRGNHNVRLGAMQQDTARLSGLVCSFASRTPLLSDTCPPRASESIKRFRYSSFSPTEAAIQIIVSMWSPPPPKVLTARGRFSTLSLWTGGHLGITAQQGVPLDFAPQAFETRHQGFPTQKGDSSECLCCPRHPVSSQNTFHRLVVETLTSKYWQWCYCNMCPTPEMTTPTQGPLTAVWPSRTAFGWMRPLININAARHGVTSLMCSGLSVLHYVTSRQRGESNVSHHGGIVDYK